MVVLIFIPVQFSILKKQSHAQALIVDFIQSNQNAILFSPVIVLAKAWEMLTLFASLLFLSSRAMMLPCFD